MNKKRKPTTQREEPEIETSNRFISLSSEDENEMETKEVQKHLKKEQSEYEDAVREKKKARMKVIRENQSEEERKKD